MKIKMFFLVVFYVFICLNVKSQNSEELNVKTHYSEKINRLQLSSNRISDISISFEITLSKDNERVLLDNYGPDFYQIIRSELLEIVERDLLIYEFATRRDRQVDNVIQREINEYCKSLEKEMPINIINFKLFVDAPERSVS